MKKSKAMLAISLVVVLIATFMGCSSKTASTTSDTDFTLELVSETIDKDDIFSNRDLSGDYDDTVENITLNNEDVTIDKEGTYILSGELNNSKITISAGEDDKVQLVLNGVTITNSDDAGIYVESADKVFITTQSGTTNTITTSGEFNDDTIDGAIYSKSDLCFNGTGSLTVVSQYGHGIVCNDDLKICSGEITVNAESHAIKANDSISITTATLNLTSGEDALHCDNTEDETKGGIYFLDGTATINAGDDGIHASYYIIVEGGTIDIQKSYEGIEAPKIELNNGDVNIISSDDGLNASSGSATSETDTQGGQQMGMNKDDSFDPNSSSSDSSSTQPEMPSGEAPSDMQNGEAPSAPSDSENGEAPSMPSNDGSGEAPSAPSEDTSNDNQPSDMQGGNQNDTQGGGTMDTDSDCYINIAGGTLTISADGDGIDSNGYLQQVGGNVVVYGPENDGNAAVDYGINAKITGGTIVAFGMSGMAESFNDCSTQGSILVTFDSQTSDDFTLTSDSGKEIISQSSEKQYNCVIVSSSEIESDGTYVATAGDQEKTIEMDSISYTDSSAGTMGSGQGQGGGMNMGARDFNKAKEEISGKESSYDETTTTNEA